MEVLSILNPILKALSIFQSSNARFLLMGGQACILYGGADFSRDIDLSVNADPADLEPVREALARLRAECVFFPPLGADVLNRGHACHFRCHAPGAEGLRIDLMSRMRGCGGFEELWVRRSIVSLPEIGEIGLLSLPDLVQSKKTQRQKDWPMIRRAIEADIIQFRDGAPESQIRFWLKESRTPADLVELAHERPAMCKELAVERPLLPLAAAADGRGLERALAQEELREIEIDREYWRPLREELEAWRRQRPR